MKISKQEMMNFIMEAIGEKAEDEGDGIQIEKFTTFQDEGYLTNDTGFVIWHENGKFNITIS